MLFQFGNVLVFILLAVGFVLASLLIGSLIRPSVPSTMKQSSYECGEEPVGSAWVNFNIRFYIIALLFIIFDVEIAFMFPVGVVFKQWVAEGKGLTALVEILIFSLILLFGLAYVWIKGDLEWVKKIGKGDSPKESG
ncbi:MAG: NADH-quinone oxidoreductase subunit A [Deltaproteobacteria bacterium]|nr:NADH-quinone oxidoreductase subunit A [Deltaproteobacteria bacterium]